MITNITAKTAHLMDLVANPYMMIPELQDQFSNLFSFSPAELESVPPSTALFGSIRILRIRKQVLGQ